MTGRAEKKSPKAGKALTVGAGHAEPGSGMPEPYEGQLIGLCFCPIPKERGFVADFPDVLSLNL